MFIKSTDLTFENYTNLIISINSKIVISSSFLSLDEIIFFYLKILPGLLLKEDLDFNVYPYFTKINKYSPKSQATLILLNVEIFRNIIIKMYENGNFK